MEYTNVFDIARLLVDGPAYKKAPHFTWQSDREVWACENDEQKEPLGARLGFPVWKSLSAVNCRLANLRIVYDRAETAVKEGFALILPLNHFLWQRFMRTQPELSFHVVSRSAVVALAYELQYNENELLKLLQTICDVKHYLHFSGALGERNAASSPILMEQAESVIFVHEPPKPSHKRCHPTALPRQPKVLPPSEALMIVTDRDHLRYSNAESREIEMFRQRTKYSTFDELCNCLHRSRGVVKRQISEHSLVERDAEFAVAEGICLIPGTDTELLRIGECVTYSGVQAVTQLCGQSVAQVQLRVELTRAVKRYLRFAGVHD